MLLCSMCIGEGRRKLYGEGLSVTILSFLGDQ